MKRETIEGLIFMISMLLSLGLTVGGLIGHNLTLAFSGVGLIMFVVVVVLAMEYSYRSQQS